MEFLKLILEVPIHLVQFLLRLGVAILNVFPCHWGRMWNEKSFIRYNDKTSREFPMEYRTECDEKMHLGHWLVAYLRGDYQKQTLFQIKEVPAGPLGLEKNHVIVSKKVKRAVHQNHLAEIRFDCKVLSRQSD